MLPKKSRESLEKYHHQLVIGNILGEHQDRVILYRPSKEEVLLERSEEEKKQDIDIEIKLIEQVASFHEEFLQQKKK